MKGRFITIYVLTHFIVPYLGDQAFEQKLGSRDGFVIIQTKVNYMYLQLVVSAVFLVLSNDPVFNKWKYMIGSKHT